MSDHLATLHASKPRRECGIFQTIEPKQTLVLLDNDGPGMVTHIWITMAHTGLEYRQLVFRMYWDHEDRPSVECPVGDFFCQGFNQAYPLVSQLVAVGNERGLNCFFPMPFKRHGRIEVCNEGLTPVTGFFHYVDYQLTSAEAVDSSGYFHAQYRQEQPVTPGDYLIVEAEGRGHFVGCNLQVQAQTGGWWGEGDDFFYVDDELYDKLGAKVTFRGSGVEDYFCNAWGFTEGQSTPYFGSPLFSLRYGRSLMYRWHYTDPFDFQKSFRMTIQHQGQVWPSRESEIKGEAFIANHGERMGDNYCSVAYWYQREPHRPFEPSVPFLARIPFPNLNREDELVLHDAIRCIVKRKDQQHCHVYLWRVLPESQGGGCFDFGELMTQTKLLFMNMALEAKVIPDVRNVRITTNMTVMEVQIGDTFHLKSLLQKAYQQEHRR